MKSSKSKKASYKAPRIEATSFKVEQGYAGSTGGGGGGGGGSKSAGTDKFTNVQISWPS